jgi:membrane protease YdiL (CAAX protease family)
VALGRASVPAPILAAFLGAGAVGVEWLRVLAARTSGWEGPALLVGGAALCAFALVVPAASLGLGRRRLALRVLAGLALGALLLLPAVARGAATPVLPAGLLLPAALVAVGEEVAFRGALFAALDEAYGPAAAVLGSTLAFVAAHLLSHPVAFLPSVAALGLLFGLWRWAFRDLVAPITAHVLADVAL